MSTLPKFVGVYAQDEDRQGLQAVGLPSGRPLFASPMPRQEMPGVFRPAGGAASSFAGKVSP